MSYRKLTEQELDGLLGKSRNVGKDLMPIIRQFYQTPDDAVSILVSFDSEYNDETYSNSVEYAGVYNGKGHEIYPKPGVERDARTKLKGEIARLELFQYETEDGLNDMVIRLKTPELYVKTDND